MRKRKGSILLEVSLSCWCSEDILLYVLILILLLILSSLIRILGHSSSQILLSTSVASLSCRQSVSSLCSIVWSLPIGIIEIRCCIILCCRWAIEVIEHKIHVFSLLSLQMILDCLISMHLDLNMSVCLSRESSWLCKLTVLALTQNFLPLHTPLLFLFWFLIVTHIECLPSKVFACLANTPLRRSRNRTTTLTNIWISRLALVMHIICLCSIWLEFLISSHHLLLSLLLLIRIIKVVWGDSKFAPILSSVLLHIILYDGPVLVFIVRCLLLELWGVIGICGSINTCYAAFLIEGRITHVLSTVLCNILCSLGIGTNIGILSI